MGHCSISEIAITDASSAFLGLVGLVAGGGQHANNVWEPARRFTTSPPMQVFEALLDIDADRTELIASPPVMLPLDAGMMRSLL
jgi:hypothetical protein